MQHILQLVSINEFHLNQFGLQNLLEFCMDTEVLYLSYR